MEKELFNYVEERAKVLAVSGASKQETKDAAQAWLDAVAADDTAADDATTALLDILEGRPTTIDDLIALLKGPGKEIFGEEKAATMLETQLERKEQGAKFCSCDACTAASEILAKFGRAEL